MTPLRFILASLRHYRRVHIAVALGVAVATAVLTGALVVGDSMHGSLRELTLQRLGRIDSALVAGHMFRAELADELARAPVFQDVRFAVAEPTILMTGTLQAGAGGRVHRATKVTVIGIEPEFWSLGAVEGKVELTEDQVALTEPLARELGVNAGDAVLLRLPTANAIPADSPLGEKSDTSIGRQLNVASVLPPVGIARFSLMPSQQLPRNAFVPLATMQSLLEKPGGANAILVATTDARQASSDTERRALQRASRPRLEDFGVHFEHVELPAAYARISSDTLVLNDEVLTAAERAFDGQKLQSVSTYLANTLVAGEGESRRKIPYSTIAGVDSLPGIGPLLDDSGAPIALADDEIALNQWAADDLQVKEGDTITVTFYEPESTHGILRERTPAPTFKLKSIVPLETADGTPTPTADPKLTPELPGVTDQDSIRDWDLPFELVETIRDNDEDYWDKYRTTPKAFVSLATAKRLWPSRWGTVSLLRVPDGEAASAAGGTANKLAAAIDPAALGMTFLPVKQQGLDSAGGTTPFSGLFLGFSFFLIAAAMMLIAILFQLGVQQRARELGTLSAVGVGRNRIASLLGREGLLIAVVGATLGVVGGILYAWLMILGLRTWWLAAISTPFLELHVWWPSLVIGWFAGVVLSWATIRWSIRRLTRSTVARLLSGSLDTRAENAKARSRGTAWPIARFVLLLLVVGIVVNGFRLQGEIQAAAFFGSGALTLALLLGEIRHQIRADRRKATAGNALSLLKLSRLNAARNPGRSTLTIGLVAAASFLILAISAFRLETSDAGTGGFDYIATSDRPIHFDLNTKEGRLELGFSDADSEQLADWTVYSMRVSDGEDASCLNLYRPTQPRVLGVPIDFVERGGFQWSAVRQSKLSDPVRDVRAAVGIVDQPNPWTNLTMGIGNDENGRPIVPVVIDAATAIYSLHLKGVGSLFTIRDSADQPVTLEVVGLLKNSVLQGNLLISEDHFVRFFTDTGG
jgi:ABC-type lipoprotein release transport system permease subunit